MHRLRDVRVGVHHGGPQRALPGPAGAQPRAFTLVRDSRDAAGERRWAVLLSDDAARPLPRPGQLHRRCPMELAPTTSIIRLRALATRKLLGLS